MTKRSDSPCEEAGQANTSTDSPVNVSVEAESVIVAKGANASYVSNQSGCGSDGESNAPTSAEVSLNLTSGSPDSHLRNNTTHTIENVSEAIQRTLSDDDSASGGHYSNHSSPPAHQGHSLANSHTAPTHAIQSIMQTLVGCTEKYLNDTIKYEPI